MNSATEKERHTVMTCVPAKRIIYTDLCRITDINTLDSTLHGVEQDLAEEHEDLAMTGDEHPLKKEIAVVSGPKGGKPRLQRIEGSFGSSLALLP